MTFFPLSKDGSDEFLNNKLKINIEISIGGESIYIKILFNFK
jgi:hypothetical protein